MRDTMLETGELEIDRRERLRIPAPRLDYRPVEERIQDFDEACLGFGLESARVEAQRCIECPSPQGCILACPLHNDIPAALWAIAEGRMQDAAAIFRQTSSFPELCGRLCPDEYLCAGSCGVGRAHPSIRIGRLEVFVAEYQRDMAGPPVVAVAPPTGRRVAVVGSGPAGLTVAEALAKLGHTVTVFELRSRPGGMLTYTIPRFRLPLSVVEDKITQLASLGIAFVFETQVGPDLTIDDLFRDGYDAVLLGTGAGFEAAVDIPGHDLAGVYRATEFLMHINVNRASSPREHSPVSPGDRVTVFGSGHSAVDCARAAVRLGAGEVTCYHRGPELEEMSRFEDKLAALEEGVRFVPLVEAVALIGDERGHVVQVLCQRLRLSGRDPTSRLLPIEGATYLVDSDLVICAPERGPNRLLAATTPGLQTTPTGWLIDDKASGQTTRRGVFAAGDNTGAVQLAAVAIAEGLKVAAAMHRYLDALDD